jgi:hypothetical protein
MPHAVMKVLKLALVSTRASSTVHDIVLALCIQVYEVVLLLDISIAVLTFHLCFFTVHHMSLNSTPSHALLTVKTFNGDIRTWSLMALHLLLCELCRATFTLTTACIKLILALAFMLLQSIVRHFLFAAWRSMFACKDKLWEHIPDDLMGFVLELRLFTAFKRTVVAILEPFLKAISTKTELTDLAFVWVTHYAQAYSALQLIFQLWLVKNPFLA